MIRKRHAAVGPAAALLRTSSGAIPATPFSFFVPSCESRPSCTWTARGMPSRPLHVRQAKDSASVDRALVAAALASVAAASFIAQPWTKSDMEAVQGPGGSGGSDDNSKVKDKLLPMSEVMSQIQDRLKQF